MSALASIQVVRNGSSPRTGSLPGPAVRYTRNGGFRMPPGEGSRAISVTGTRMPCSGSVLKASEWDFSDCVVAAD
ncbi:hypothetical protein SRABI128_04719 [Microbacterium sp. Bi128]|nr:hypothetical protein SRABI128_04719 [Microbacterium sp. Bi128]